MFDRGTRDETHGSPGPFEERRCRKCHGSGRAVFKRVCFGPNPHNEYTDCGACYGTGWLPVERTDVKPKVAGFKFVLLRCVSCTRTALVDTTGSRGFPVCHGKPMEEAKKMAIQERS